jgi:hypothetical protein
MLSVGLSRKTPIRTKNRASSDLRTEQILGLIAADEQCDEMCEQPQQTFEAKAPGLLGLRSAPEGWAGLRCGGLPRVNAKGVVLLP